MGRRRREVNAKIPQSCIKTSVWVVSVRNSAKDADSAQHQRESALICDSASFQQSWIFADEKQNTTKCTLASSGESLTLMQPFQEQEIQPAFLCCCNVLLWWKWALTLKLLIKMMLFSLPIFMKKGTINSYVGSNWFSLVQSWNIIIWDFSKINPDTWLWCINRLFYQKYCTVGPILMSELW